MITRIWRGWTRPEQADAYQQLLLEEIFTGIAAYTAIVAFSCCAAHYDMVVAPFS
jgi:hypothetical protein